MTVDLSPHIKDLMTAYKTMPPTPRRERIIQLLQETYLLATSDSLTIKPKEASDGRNEDRRAVSRQD